MKLIALINKYDKSKNNHDISYSYVDIIKRIIEVGGYPIQINLLDANMNVTKKLLKLVDGVIFQGGDDYTNNEIALIKFLYDNDIKTLGICLGMQTLAVTFNGLLGQVLNHNNTFHQVILKRDSKIYEILKKEKIMVNSRHNYQVLKTDLSVSGTCKGVVEVVEDKNKKFFLGVAWHPESLNNDDSKNLFFYFVNE